jgi:hypothetical protein
MNIKLFYIYIYIKNMQYSTDLLGLSKEYAKINDNNVNLFANTQGVKYMQTKNQRIQEILPAEQHNGTAVIEGFTSLYDTIISRNNNTEVEELLSLEKEYQDRLTEFNTAKGELMHDSDEFINSTSSKNPYLGHNVRLQNGTYGYVTARGVFKEYPENGYASMNGKAGCPKGNVMDINRNIEGDKINVNPMIRVGTPLEQNQGCGGEGGNIYSILPGYPAVHNYVGCFSTNLVNNKTMEYQEDMGNTATLENCKLRAFDMGQTVFGLTNGKEGTSKCYLGGNDVNALKIGGESYHPIVSWKSGGENKTLGLRGGLNYGGQLVVAMDQERKTGNASSGLICQVYTGGSLTENWWHGLGVGPAVSPLFKTLDGFFDGSIDALTKNVVKNALFEKRFPTAEEIAEAKRPPVQMAFNQPFTFYLYTPYFGGTNGKPNLSWFNGKTPKVTGTTNNLSNIQTATNNSGGSYQTTSVKWTGKFTATNTGTYTFYTSSDDACFLAIDGNIVVYNGGDHGTRTVYGTLNMVAGQTYTVDIYWGNNRGPYAFSAGYIIPKKQISLTPGPVQNPKTSIVDKSVFLTGFFRPDMPGEWKISISMLGDVKIWIGNHAYNDWNWSNMSLKKYNNNVNNTMYLSMNVKNGIYYPIRIHMKYVSDGKLNEMIANGRANGYYVDAPNKFSMKIIDPNGDVRTDCTNLFYSSQNLQFNKSFVPEDYMIDKYVWETPKPSDGCDPQYGGRINATETVATYGFNCNSPPWS